MWRTRGCTQNFWNQSYCFRVPGVPSLGYLAAICLLPTLNHWNMFLLFTFCSFHINFRLFVSLMVHLSKPGVTARGDKTFFRGGIWHLMPPRQITTHPPGNTYVFDSYKARLSCTFLYILPLSLDNQSPMSLMSLVTGYY